MIIYKVVLLSNMLVENLFKTKSKLCVKLIIIYVFNCIYFTMLNSQALPQSSSKDVFSSETIQNRKEKLNNELLELLESLFYSYLRTEHDNKEFELPKERIVKVQTLLKEGADVNAKDEGGDTPLFYAASIGDLNLVKILLDKGADVNIKNGWEKSVLHPAGSRGHVAVVKILLDKGVDVNAVDTMKNTVLFNAAVEGHVAVVKVLLDKGADVNAKNENQFTPLLIAVLLERVEVVKVLLDFKDTVVDSADKYQQSALQIAARYGYTEIAKLLLENGADVNFEDINKRISLHHAAIYGNVEIVEALLDRGADVSAIDKFNKSPLHLAARGRHFEIVLLIADVIFSTK